MVEVVIPKLDETTEVATVERWLVQEGERVQQGQAICEVETDKAIVQVEAPAAGILRRQLIPVGTEVPPLTVVALLGDKGESVPEVDPSARTGLTQEAVVPRAKATSAPIATPSSDPATTAGSGASPRARRLAKELGVDIGSVNGTGPGGKITDRDVQAAAGV